MGLTLERPALLMVWKPMGCCCCCCCSVTKSCPTLCNPIDCNIQYREGYKKPKLHSWRVHAQTHLLWVPAQRQQIESCQNYPRVHCSLHWTPAPAPSAPALLPTRQGSPLQTHLHTPGKKQSQLRTSSAYSQDRSVAQIPWALILPLTKAETQSQL